MVPTLDSGTRAKPACSAENDRSKRFRTIGKRPGARGIAFAPPTPHRL
jgi:hypothetical protein